MLLTPRDLKLLLPLNAPSHRFILQSRQTVCKLLSRSDSRIALVIGPCSIHDQKSALEYARQLKTLAVEVEKTCFLVMRVYLEKPRTSTGWKGFLYDPHLDGSNDMATGIRWSRALLLELAKMEVPVATEFLDPLVAPYLEDLITWGFIGARTSASQPHRELASLLPLPIGFKNTIEGDVNQAIHAVVTARSPHTFFHINDEGKLQITQSEGNKDTHLVLRGSNVGPNYDFVSVNNTLEKLRHRGIKSSLLIDCSHGNSQKDVEKQKEAFYTVLQQIEEGREEIAGMMLESHLKAGNQFLSEDPASLKYGVSITDPCLDWETARTLIQSADVLLSAQKTLSTS